MITPPVADLSPLMPSLSNALASTSARIAAGALAFACLGGGPRPAHAVEPQVQHDVVLLQTGSVIEQRVEGGANAMADYVRRLGEAATQAMRDNPKQIPSAGFIVVAARHDGRAHAWFDFKPALSPTTITALTHVVETVAPAPVKSGTIVFALRVSIWGAKPPAAYAPAPQEWRDAAKRAGHKLDVEALVDQLWPR
jgi:hypothetical protein